MGKGRRILGHASDSPDRATAPRIRPPDPAARALRRAGDRAEPRAKNRTARMTPLAKPLALAALIGLAAAPAPAQRAGAGKPPITLNWNAAVYMLRQAPIARSLLPPPVRRALLRAVTDQMVSGLSSSLAARQRALVPSFPMEMVVLGGLGRRAAVVQALSDDCGRRGCPLFVFRWTGECWASLLRASGGTLFPQPARSHGWRSLVVGKFSRTGRVPGASSARGASKSTLLLFRFNGRRYIRAGCWQALGWQVGDRLSLLRACPPRRAH